MKIIRAVSGMQRLSARFKASGKKIGFVPTMGALHAGHLSLIRRARKENDVVVVSIFVNPAQFGPKEDLRRYPRSLRKDSSLCKKCGVDIIFNPKASSLYPSGYRTYVNVGGLSEVLCGYYRKGHFRGVATVVAKLFNIVRPDSAYFGQKDAQQCLIIKKMIADLNIPLELKVLPTVREKDGLALSSRNNYLDAAERKDATVLSEALSLAQGLAKRGIRDTSSVIRQMRSLILKKRNARIEYICVVDSKELTPLSRISGGALLALAVRIGRTRLIDNSIIRF